MVRTTIISFNVNGLSDRIKHREVFNYLHSKNYDIILLQETHSTVSCEKQWSAEWGRKIWFSHGESNAKGVAILFHRDIQITVHNVLSKQQGRALTMYVTFGNSKFLLCNLYAPNQDNPRFFSESLEDISHYNPDYHIIAGDFNLALDPSIDRKGSTFNNDKASKWLRSYIEENELIDTWRHFHPDLRHYTWKKLKPKPSFSRLDYILTNSHFDQFIEKVDIGYGFRSDHSIVRLTFMLETRTKGPGYWKFNTMLLKDLDYVEKINKLIDIKMAQPFSSYKLKWESIKLVVRGTTLQFSARRQKSNRNKIEILERKIEQLEMNLHHSYPFQDTQEQLRLLKHELQTIQKLKTQGAMICSRSNWVAKGEMPTKYFLNLEKRRAQQKTIFRVKSPTGQIVDTEKEVLKEIQTFYSRLYTSKGQIDYSYLDKLEIPKITQEMRTLLDRDIELKEVSVALDQPKNGKSPGTDGLPPDFYKMFWPKLKDFMHELFLEVVQEGQLHLTARYGILSLLEKLRKDTLLLNSWRPLTLLNTDNKIYGKILANRLNMVIDSLVHPSQTGFIKGRLMSENTMQIMQLLDYCDSKEISAFLVSFDFAKAFDCLEWEAIFSALVAFNFGPRYIDMVMTLFTNPLICASNNGYWSEFWNPSRGCRQGCTYSPIIFVLTVELLGIAIRQNANIEGITIGNTEIKSGQFADDLWTITPSQNGINAILHELIQFEAFSGLQINADKCAVLRVGPHKNSEAKYYTLKKLFWSPGAVRILGLEIFPDPLITYHENYVSLLDRVEAIIENWAYRNLTIMGKITIINVRVWWIDPDY